jgi:urease accessory protein
MHGAQLVTAPVGLASTASLLEPVRVRGGVDVEFAVRGGETFASSVYEHGGYRVLLPKACGRTEAVIINTGGGMAGGDHVSMSFKVAEHGALVATSQAAERVYRTLGPVTRTTVRLEAGHNARLFWLPQETILYSGAKLGRRLEADVAGSASLLVSEIAIFGRDAMGERVMDASFSDQWRVRRDGRLVLAEAMLLDGPIDKLLQRRSVADGSRVVATMLWMAPNAEDQLEAARASLEGSRVRAAASSWNGLLLVRMIGEKSEAVRRSVAAVVRALTASDMPRVWAT